MSEDKVARISLDVKLLRLDGQRQAYCPHCGYGPLDGVTGVRTGTQAEVFRETGGRYQPDNPPPPMLPTPGTPSICTSCGGLLVFNEDLQQVAPSDEEVAVWKADPRLWADLTRLSDGFKRRRQQNQ